MRVRLASHRATIVPVSRHSPEQRVDVHLRAVAEPDEGVSLNCFSLMEVVPDGPARPPAVVRPQPAMAALASVRNFARVVR